MRQDPLFVVATEEVYEGAMRRGLARWLAWARHDPFPPASEGVRALVDGVEALDEKSG